MGKAEHLPGGQENPCVLEATSLAQAHAVKARLAAYGVTDPRHVTTILAVLDQHGLFHEVTTPKEGDIRKEIGRRAKRMAKDLWNRITDIRKGKRPAANPHEADLAQRWEQLSADRMLLEELKVLSETFQINRGGRIIPRYASQESRKRSHKGPRSAREKSHAVQILDRYLKQECAMRPNRRLECLGDILRSAMNLQDSREDVSEQVRWRLRDAETKTPLHHVDYYEATGVSYKLNDDRQKVFWECQSILYSPDTSAEKKKKAEDTLQKLFPFDWSRLRQRVLLDETLSTPPWDAR
jgi:hypothetical protein